jgi:hypothetical protein
MIIEVALPIQGLGCDKTENLAATYPQNNVDAYGHRAM